MFTIKIKSTHQKPSGQEDKIVGRKILTLQNSFIYSIVHEDTIYEDSYMCKLYVSRYDDKIIENSSDDWFEK